MNILEIYEKYTLPPNLVKHQLEVASVGATVCDLSAKGERREVVETCLLHDMGNIIKYKFDIVLPGSELENIEYWKEVQKSFIDKYGPNEHEATLEIAKEIGVPDRIRTLIDGMGFDHSVEALDTGDMTMMIAAYSDMRVAPHGVVSLEERLSDLRKRYGTRLAWERCENAFYEMETLFFKDSEINPEDINQSSTEEKREQLKKFEI